MHTNVRDISDISALWGRLGSQDRKAQQPTFDGFIRSCGMKSDAKDEWVFLADRIDWAAVETENRAPFHSKRGCPAVSERTALDSFLQVFSVSNSRFALLHFTDPPDGAITYHVVGIEDEAACRHGLFGIKQRMIRFDRQRSLHLAKNRCFYGQTPNSRNGLTIRSGLLADRSCTPLCSARTFLYGRILTNAIG